ncbi:hypothetical protein TREMEDRAFT_62098 [Tremella mesenterica DSM 1558]|uniref:uncharacterized protein n=1 Tax=Tremella mesenterica (strain ATCC 24925 / CBS 8224 / DSM 1558 / NBRC 9311 / NRRL Y-6157 / RJB 2259-6 / UBC 559-6) TaxID=578456 RepID=UPI0003F49E54|nr:uncharacterized protein TREMEDRAFT_62098 [Tremella mesenterica DSM 1558]EIW69247.1 hypothetical protein TREMEDRAFT_62098 [Tremella mesenterica DSM 1558]
MTVRCPFCRVTDVPFLEESVHQKDPFIVQYHDIIYVLPVLQTPTSAPVLEQEREARVFGTPANEEGGFHSATMQLIEKLETSREVVIDIPEGNMTSSKRHGESGLAFIWCRPFLPTRELMEPGRKVYLSHLTRETNEMPRDTFSDFAIFSWKNDPLNGSNHTQSPFVHVKKWIIPNVSTNLDTPSELRHFAEAAGFTVVQEWTEGDQCQGALYRCFSIRYDHLYILEPEFQSGPDQSSRVQDV